MPSLKEVRIRINSVISTKQITSAMKMVSASKLRRAQNAIIKLRPYSIKLNEILQNLKSSISGSDEAVYSEQRGEENVLLVLLTSNRGLCGAFNSNIIKTVTKLASEKYATQNAAGKLHLMCIGKKGSDYFSRRNFKIAAIKNEIYDSLSFENANLIALELMSEFNKGTYDKIEIVYNQFKNAAVQKLIVEQFLPISESQDDDHGAQSDYIFEPDKTQIIKDLVPRTLRVQFYKTLLDSFASEHGARMTAMHKATDNAEELLKDLRLAYNKARQASITKEILEIISGANALKE